MEVSVQDLQKHTELHFESALHPLSVSNSSSPWHVIQDWSQVRNTSDSDIEKQLFWSPKMLCIVKT